VAYPAWKPENHQTYSIEAEVSKNKQMFYESQAQVAWPSISLLWQLNSIQMNRRGHRLTFPWKGDIKIFACMLKSTTQGRRVF
jgi:hypothetical protein